MWLINGFLLLFCSLIAASWILFGAYVVPGNVSNLKRYIFVRILALNDALCSDRHIWHIFFLASKMRCSHVILETFAS